MLSDSSDVNRQSVAFSRLLLVVVTVVGTEADVALLDLVESGELVEVCLVEIVDVVLVRPSLEVQLLAGSGRARHDHENSKAPLAVT